MTIIFIAIADGLLIVHLAEGEHEEVERMGLGTAQQGGYGVGKQVVVAIDKLHPLPLGMAEGEVAGSSLAGMALHIEGDACLVGKLGDHMLRTHRALIIDHNDFILIARQALPHDAAEATTQEAIFKIICGDDEAYHGMRRLVNTA